MRPCTLQVASMHVSRTLAVHGPVGAPPPPLHLPPPPNVTCLNVTCASQVQDVLDGFVSLLDDAGAEKSDLRVPAGELGEMIEKMFGEGKDLIVSVIKAMGEEHIIAVKEAAEGK